MACAIRKPDAFPGQGLFAQAMRNIRIFLAKDRVHGDLSAYNVLYWQGRAVVIDFPQAVVASTNRNAEWLLGRDVTRLCQYFGRYGVDADAAGITGELWSRFERGQL